MADEIPAWASDEYDPTAREAAERLQAAEGRDPLEERSFETIDYPQPAPDPYEERPKVVRPAPAAAPVRPAQSDVVERALRATSDQFQSNTRPVVENGKINWGDQELGGSAADFFRADAARMAALEAASAPSGATTGRSGTGTGRIMAYAPTPGSDMDTPVLRAIRGAESSNDPRAQNPRSSAGGLYQFTDATWGNVLRRMNPQTYGGYNNQQLRSLKFNADLQNEAAKFHLNNDIVPALQKAGIPPTPANVYLGWFQGPAGAIRAYRAPPNATVAQVFPETVSANAGTRFRGKPYAAWTMDDLREFTASAMSRRMRASGGAVNDFIPRNDARYRKNLAAWHEGSHSATKNDDGSPRIYYHGSNQKLNIIKPDMRDPGAWFTTNSQGANNYARGENSYLHEVYLKSNNPMIVPFDYDENDKLHAFHNGKQLPFSDNVSIVKYAKKNGYDGVHFPYGNFSEDDNTFVVFDANQIKSVDNEGGFNPHEDDINKAEGGTVDDDDDEGLTAYHGSPHDFERFDINKIGTGEGAQAYGHGLYFAESEPVAKGYRDRLKEEYAFVDDKKIPHPSEENPESNLVYTLANQLYQMGWNTDQAIDFANKHAESLKDDLNSESFYKKGKAEHAQKWANDIAQFKGKKIEWKQDPGNMYEVRIKAKPEHFLDWDKPLSEQGDYVKSAVLNMAQKLPSYIEPITENSTGNEIEQAVRWLGKKTSTSADASKVLLAHGIKGIKYLDAGSRGAGEGSRNYVVFDHDLVKVKRKYALGGAVAHA